MFDRLLSDSNPVNTVCKLGFFSTMDLETDNGDLMLNLSTVHIATGTGRVKVVGNRGQRIRARRAAKLKTQESQNEVNESSSDENEIQSGKNHNDTHVAKSLGTNANNPARGQVISSLFNRNPAVPKVPKASVNPVKEEVFSSRSFNDMKLHPYMVSNLEEKLGLKQMTSVQTVSIPVLLRGSDALIKSQTGSGKTLAYAIPVIQTLQLLSPRIQRSDGPYAIVIVPTRELALQSLDTFTKLVKPFVWIIPGCFMGGEKRKAEKARLRKGINVLIGTPGRLLDHIEHTGSLDFSRIRWVIFDEADRLLDMGYEKDVSRIVNALNESPHPNRQTVMLSATLSPGVERLAGITLNTPVRISVQEDDEETKTLNKSEVSDKPLSSSGTSTAKENFSMPEKLKQEFILVPCKLRLVTMVAFILSKCKFSSSKSKMIVFMSTQDSVEFHHQIFNTLINRNNSADSGMDSGSEEADHERENAIDFFKLHGEMPQKERTRVYQDFSRASSGVLLCTDVAARGLDLPKVKWIVQYTAPGAATEYVHRVGRTARAGSLGHGLLFLMPHEAEYIQNLQAEKISLSELALDDVLKVLLLYVKDLPLNQHSKRETPRTYEEAATLLQLKMEEHLLGNKDLFNLAEKAYQSFIKGYSTYPAQVKSIFHVKHLHLGHLAKSFGLRETPKGIGMGFTKLMASASNKKRKHSNKITFRDDSSEHSNKRQRRDLSEFSSGKQNKKKSFSSTRKRKKKSAK